MDTLTKVFHVTDANFEKEVIEASKIMPVFIDVYADWCPPCKAIAPTVEKFNIDPSYTGKVKIVKMDSDSNPLMVQKYEIMSIPTLMVFAHGEKKFQNAGALDEKGMREIIETNGLKFFPEVNPVAA
jgi:thioredoxin 1